MSENLIDKLADTLAEALTELDAYQDDPAYFGSPTEYNVREALTAYAAYKESDAV